MTDSITNNAAQAPEPDYDAQLAQLRARQNFALAIPAGLAAAVVGAVLWAVFVYATGMELGLIAVAVGALVGYAIRRVGRGIDPQFGVLGAICAALGWALGTALCDLAFLAKDTGGSFFDALSAIGAGQMISLMVRSLEAMDFLFLAIAVWEGWKLSRHPMP
jgi:hypothetical protein